MMLGSWHKSLVEFFSNYNSAHRPPESDPLSPSIDFARATHYETHHSEQENDHPPLLVIPGMATTSKHFVPLAEILSGQWGVTCHITGHVSYENLKKNKWRLHTAAPNIPEQLNVRCGSIDRAAQEIAATIGHLTTQEGKKLNVLCHSWGSLPFLSAWLSNKFLQDKVGNILLESPFLEMHERFYEKEKRRKSKHDWLKILSKAPICGHVLLTKRNLERFSTERASPKDAIENPEIKDWDAFIKSQSSFSPIGMLESLECGRNIRTKLNQLSTEQTAKITIITRNGDNYISTPTVQKSANDCQISHYGLEGKHSDIVDIRNGQLPHDMQTAFSQSGIIPSSHL